MLPSWTRPDAPRCSTSSAEVFGWTEGDNSTEQGNPLILYTGEMRQFLYLLPGSGEFLRAPRLDHFGLEVGSPDELVEILERAKEYQEA